MTDNKTINGKNGIVFDIERFAVHDGPGIRTLVFLKGCPLSCLWCENPESQAVSPQLMYYPDKCIGCGDCIPACPAGANGARNSRIHFDRTRCRDCLKCVEVCPSRARERCGTPMTVEEVMDVVRKDRPFYAESGGGVTLSGGEPLIQMSFIGEVLKACKDESIHTAIETSGYADWDGFNDVLEFVDLILFDVKQMDPQVHKKTTGVDNRLILQNLKSIDDACIPIIVRIPLIPGYNDEEENLIKTAEFLSDLKHVGAVHLLPYHNLGGYKYRLLGMQYDLEDLDKPDDENIARAAALFKSYSFKVVVGG
jgi:pyruvate formate lyase activating enzyme